MKAIIVRRPLRMGCGESLQHQRVQGFAFEGGRAGAPLRPSAEPESWSTATEVQALNSPDGGKGE